MKDKKEEEKEIETNNEFSISINKFGEIEANKSIDDINKMLNDELDDKKLNKSDNANS